MLVRLISVFERKILSSISSSALALGILAVTVTRHHTTTNKCDHNVVGIVVLFLCFCLREENQTLQSSVGQQKLHRLLTVWWGCGSGGEKPLQETINLIYLIQNLITRTWLLRWPVGNTRKLSMYTRIGRVRLNNSFWGKGVGGWRFKEVGHMLPDVKSRGTQYEKSQVRFVPETQRDHHLLYVLWFGVWIGCCFCY